MVDVVDSKTSSRMMSGIRSKDTKPEMAVRRFLHGQGFATGYTGEVYQGHRILFFQSIKRLFLCTGASGMGMTAAISGYPRPAPSSGLRKYPETGPAMLKMRKRCLPRAGKSLSSMSVKYGMMLVGRAGFCKS